MISLEYTATKAELDHGAGLFYGNCAVCHELVKKGGVVPGLGYATKGTFDIFEDILSGMYVNKGMPDFSDRFSRKDMTDIKNFILHSAKEVREEANTK